MQIYEEQNPFQSFQGGGGFNPVNEPDVAGAMERELRGGERRDRLYYDSMTRNDEQRVRNAQINADKITKDKTCMRKNLNSTPAHVNHV